MFVYEFQIKSRRILYSVGMIFFATFVVSEFTPLFEHSSIALLLLIDAINRIEL